MRTILIIILAAGTAFGKDTIPGLSASVTVNEKENVFTVKGKTYTDFSSSKTAQWRFVYEKETLVVSPFMASGVTYSPRSIVEAPTLELAIDTIIKLGLKLTDEQKERILRDAEEQKIKLTPEQLEFLYVDEKEIWHE